MLGDAWVLGKGCSGRHAASAKRRQSKRKLDAGLTFWTRIVLDYKTRIGKRVQRLPDTVMVRWSPLQPGIWPHPHTDT